MSEIGRLVRAAREAQGRGAALATVVSVEGSAYRRPGARMLVRADGTRTGQVSGGCLENDLAQRAALLTPDGGACLVTYDTTAPGDVLFGTGLGCRGIVRVLLEPLDSAPCRAALDFLEETMSRRRGGVLGTVYESDRAEEAGARVWTANGDKEDEVLEGGGENLPHNLQSRLRDEARRVLSEDRSQRREYDLAPGRAVVFWEVVTPPHALTLFGDGEDVVPLARLADGLGWDVTVVTTRPGADPPAGLPERTAFQSVCVDEGLRLDLPPGGAAVLMTHNFLHDYELLKLLLPSSLRYVGVLGPRRRTDEMLAKLPCPSLLPGVTLAPDQLARLYAPLGLDVGAETPAEVALSALAEIQAVLSGRGGGSLRERQAGIHAP